MKLGGWMIMLITMMVVLEFTGVPTGLSGVLGTFGVDINPATADLITADMENSGFFAKIFGNLGILVALAAGGAIIVGLFAKSYDVSLVILPLIVFIGTTLAATSWSVIKYIQVIGQDWMTAIVATLFVAVFIGFAMSCVDYFAGR